MSDIVLMEALAAGAYAAMRTLSYHDRKRAERYVVTSTTPKTQPGSSHAAPKPKPTQPGPPKLTTGAKPKPKPAKPGPGSANYVAGYSKLSRPQQAELRAAQAKIDALKRAAAKAK